MRMAEAIQVPKRRVHLRMQRIAEVHHDGTARLVIVGKQQPPGWHPVFGVVHLLTADSRCGGGDEPAVTRRSWFAIDDGNEILAAPSRISSPGKEIVRWRRRPSYIRPKQQRGHRRGRQPPVHCAFPVLNASPEVSARTHLASPPNR